MGEDHLDNIFRLLATATKLEENDDCLEASVKYYEALYLMRQYLQRLPETELQTRDLLSEKVKHYEQQARKCVTSGNASIAAESPCSDARRSIVSDPRSPVAPHGFFNEDSSVIPLPAPSFTPLKKPQQSPRFSLSSHVNQTTSRANAKLAKAMDIDEKGEIEAAIATYMEAAELYLKAIKATEENANKNDCGENVGVVLKRRLEQTLDRVEQLKHPAQHSARKQNKVHVEQKQRQQQRRASALTPEEISVLKRSSLISSGLFLPWSDEEAQALSAAPKSTLNLFRDDGDLKLADKQAKIFYKWARPAEILQLRQQFRGHGSVGKPVMVLGSVSPYRIRQYGVTDCSFIASLVICAAYERRFQKSLISPIVYPQTSDGKMCYNPEGKYMVKLWLNGVARQVIVDDRLPIDKQGNLLCAHTQCPPGQLEIYVPIIEKAFLKMAGGFANGYNFPGSNSGVDLYSLTGWIPERILFPKDPMKIRDHETPKDRAWERLMSAHSFGDCLITMSSETSLTEEQADRIGLITGHAYACISVVQSQEGTRLVQLKNPWAHKGWRGRYSCYDTKNWNANLRAELGYDPELAQKQDDGVFWLCWDDVLVYFQNIHMSWNPALFAYCTSTHGFWRKDQGPSDDTFNCGENPQYVMTVSDQALRKGASIWILISRHVTKQEQEGVEVKDYLTLHLHKNDRTKQRIWYSHSKKNVLTGAYTNNPHCLVRYDVTDASDQYLSIVLSQYEKSHDLGYTLSCFCTEPFSLGPPAKELPFSRTLTSSWTEDSAGGPVGKKPFYTNPMFAIEVPKGGAVFQVQCSAPKALAVNVMMVPVNSYGQRATRVISDPPVDSGNYRHGFVVTPRQRAEAGTYALIVSSYSRDTGTFRVKVSTSVKLARVDEILS